MIRVVIVDDSRFVQDVFKEILNSDPKIEVVGIAADPFEARDMIKNLNPDVITLDIEMPKMDGLTFLEKIMSLRPMPVVMASTLTAKGADATLRALELGAVDYITKPGQGPDSNLESLRKELIQKVKMAAIARVGDRRRLAAHHQAAPVPIYTVATHVPLIAIGASTGGVEAIREVLLGLPAGLPPIAIVQHMPESFTASFAARLDNMVPLTVHEAQNGQKLQSGHVYIAPGGRHMAIVKKSTDLVVHLEDSPAVSGHRPSVDFMFHSIAKLGLQDTIGVILTGMGKDGALGLLALRQLGCRTVGQNETSCVVYGMPRAAFEVGAVEKQINLQGVAQEILNLCSARVA